MYHFSWHQKCLHDKPGLAPTALIWTGNFASDCILIHDEVQFYGTSTVLFDDMVMCAWLPWHGSAADGRIHEEAEALASRGVTTPSYSTLRMDDETDRMMTS